MGVKRDQGDPSGLLKAVSLKRRRDQTWKWKLKHVLLKSRLLALETARRIAPR